MEAVIVQKQDAQSRAASHANGRSRSAAPRYAEGAGRHLQDLANSNSRVSQLEALQRRLDARGRAGQAARPVQLRCAACESKAWQDEPIQPTGGKAQVSQLFCPACQEELEESERAGGSKTKQLRRGVTIDQKIDPSQLKAKPSGPESTQLSSAAENFPVQRLILGREGNLDTRDAGQFDQVVAELRSLGYNSLVVVRSMLDPGNRQDAGYIGLIDYLLTQADVLHGISEKSANYGGIFTSAAVFINGQLIGQTEPVISPDSSTEYYKYVLGQEAATTDELKEEHNSRNDSEVSTLEEAYNLLRPYAGSWVGQPQVRILLAGTSGPCDGCKRRLEAFQRDVLALLPQGGILSIESSYLNSTSQQTRNETQTRYGYTNQTEEFSARGERFYSYRYPLSVKDQVPASSGSFGR